MSNKRKKIFWLGLVLIIIVHLGLIFLYGMQKEGYHEDEYYSFWASAGYADLMPEGHYDWRTGPELQEQFYVSPGDEFNFEAVVWNQAEDVHPPLFYLCLNIVMSLMPGRFFKWFSIGLNTVFSLVTLMGVTFFFYHLNKQEHKEVFALTAAFMYAVAPSVISNVLLVRMYTMSGMWTVLYACALLMAIKRLESSKKTFALWTLAGTVICYFSFLTHYFSLLLPGLMTICACIYVLIKKKYIMRMTAYGLSMLAGIGLAVLTFPACIQHIFFGYRGTEVMNELNFTGYGIRLRFFSNMLNRIVWGKCMYVTIFVLVLCIAAFGVFASRKWKQTDSVEKGNWYWYITTLISCIISCLILIKISLFVEDGSRYFYPVLALMIPLIGCFVLKVLIMGMEQMDSRFTKQLGKVVFVLVFVLTLVPYVKGHIDGNVQFLYAEDGEKVAFAEAYKEYPLVFLCDRDNMYRTWYNANQIWPFHNIFYTDYDHIMLDTFDEPTIQSADKLVVYMDAPEDVVRKLVVENPNLETFTLVRHDRFYYVYLLE